jgi:hypothetical protein
VQLSSLYRIFGAIPKADISGFFAICHGNNEEWGFGKEEIMMQKNPDRSKVLNELYKISKLGMEAAEIVIPHLSNRSLSSQIKRQDERYINLMEKSRAMLKQQSEEPKGVRPNMQSMLTGAVKAEIFMRNTPQHIAEMMMRGATMGIISMTKVLNHAPDCDAKTRKTAEEFIAAEEQNIDKLKRFL